MKIEPATSVRIYPPFQTVQMSELDSSPADLSVSATMRTSAPYFEAASGSIKSFVMYHDISTMVESPMGTLGGLAPWQLKRVKSILSANIRKNIPLQDLADACRLSKSHFLREFKQSTGHTPHHWAVLHSVTLASELLAHTHLTIGQIALACGFADLAHLSRWFKRVIGVNPKSWQKQHGLKHRAAQQPTPASGTPLV